MVSMHLLHRAATAAGCCALLVLTFAARPSDAAAAACTITSNAAVIVGTSQSDVICAGDGDNVIYGGLLDDEIYGGGGNDVLIGGHGTDLLHGQTGNDVLRGGTNRDCYVGGDGVDTASFASLTPSGRDANGTPSTAGVTVDLQASSFPAEPGPSCAEFDGKGLANGEGADEELVGIENVIGSAFDDDLHAKKDSASNDLRGGGGNDILRGYSSGAADDGLRGESGTDQCRNNNVVVACTDAPEGASRPAAPHAYVENRGADAGVVVLGRLGNDPDTLAITRPSSTQVRIDFDEAPTATASCPKTATLTLTCTIATPRYVTSWGDFGNDTLSIGASGTLFPLEASLDLNGGPGDDVVTGGPNPDILFTGEGGADQLYGNAGTDALISEGDPVGSGGDYLAGGDDNDQLVTDNACAGHTLWGGNDTGTGASGDIIGFARQGNLLLPGGDRGVWAQLGTGATAGDAFAIPEPGGCVHSQVLGGGEILEGTNQHDQLRGNDAPNEIWGRDGNDTAYGLGGNDILHGLEANDILYGNEGNDTVYGEKGVDELYGGDGSDKLRSLDNRTDAAVNCGAGSDYAVEADPDDPVMSCNELG